MNDPIPFNNYDSLPEFPVHVLPKPLKDMVQHVSEVIQVDSSLPGSCVLGVLSAALLKKGVVNLLTHKEPLNLYICSIADSGERKSSTICTLTDPLYDHQYIVKKHFESESKVIATKNKIKECRLNTLIRQSANTTENSANTSIEDEIVELSQEIESNPVPNIPILIGDDITPESLGEVMSKNNECLAIISAEGGIFSIMEGRYSDGKLNLDLFLKSYSGDPWSSNRISRPSCSMNSPSLSMLLTVQPTIINSIGSNRILRGRGLFSRFLYTFVRPRAGYRLRQTQKIPQNVLVDYSDVIHKLSNISPESIELILSDDAQGSWDNFYNSAELMMRPSYKLEYLKDLGSKIAGNVARIAGLLHYAIHLEYAPNISISKETVDSAVILGNYFIEHALAVFELMQENPAIESAKKILDFINQHHPESFNGRDVQRHKSFTKIEDIEQGLAILSDRYYIKEVESTGSVVGRPKSARYEVNPKLNMLKTIDIIDNIQKVG